MVPLMEKILHHLGPKGVNSGEKLTTKGHPEWCRIFSINSVTWVVTPPSNSHHQDYYIFSRESQPKPSFATITGWGVDLKYYKTTVSSNITTCLLPTLHTSKLGQETHSSSCSASGRSKRSQMGRKCGMKCIFGQGRCAPLEGKNVSKRSTFR